MSEKTRRLRRTLAPVVVGGTIVTGAIAAGAGFATVPAGAATTASAPTHPGYLRLHTSVRGHRRELRRAGVVISAKAIGITPKALVTDLKSGNSIAGVAGQHNVGAQTVIGDLVSAADGRINRAATNGKLTATEANRLEAALPGRIAKFVNHTF